MRLLALSDIHLNINRRLDDTVAALNQIVEIASKEKISNVLILGDIYTSRRPHSKEREAFQTWIKNILRVVFLNNPEIKDSVVILRGNHDEAPDGSHSFTEFTALDYPGVTVFENPKVWNGYFLGHLLIKGAKLPNGTIMPEGITAEELIAKYPNCKAYLLGDIHQFAILRENPFMAYCGGIEHENFGERGIGKGVIIIDADEYRFVSLKNRPMIQYDVDLTKSEIFKANTDELENAIVKIVFHGTPEQIKTVSEQKIKDAVLVYAKELVVVYDIQKESVARDAQVNESITPSDALAKYVLGLQLSSEEKTEVLRLGKEIIDNART